ncbi:hypothetical protein BDP81DRAFT_411867 [Colletotrichum phormii]|uniref:C2H2-type domain-containing protein n=1 Tax=Colletotrichum phormii TaxID=359342 RepID=A0AAJ0E7F5_9PEZI|nr:uncharacterized protein BDP81DRAFT_411867 [Colletotrichum phormii]KAK1621674.1 hypothetical protein BDP81DRAFT_411867 [Colletotrichum phormii]
MNAIIITIGSRTSRISASTRSSTTITAIPATAFSATKTTSGSVHRAISDIQCPFCRQTSNTATGLIHHLERGACPNAPLDRDKLYQAVRARDPNGVISKKLLEWHASPTYPPGEQHNNPTYTATDRTHNYHIGAYECCLCHRAFSTLNGLNQHLNSPTHQQKLYHCPNHRCGREFTTLAAAINHLESESCGYMRFKAVQQNVGQILDPRRMLSFSWKVRYL